MYTPFATLEASASTSGPSWANRGSGPWLKLFGHANTTFAASSPSVRYANRVGGRYGNASTGNGFVLLPGWVGRRPILLIAQADQGVGFGILKPIG